MTKPDSSPVTFHDFYDPQHLLSDTELNTYLLETKLPREASVHGLGKLATRSILLAEALHANLVPIDSLDDLPFEIDDAEAQKVAKEVSTDVDIIVGALKTTINTVQTNPADPIIYRGIPREPDIIVGGKILAAAASEGIPRNSGRDYYQHPHEVAKIIQIACHKFGGLAPEKLNRLLFLAYCHDGFEDTFPKNNGTFLQGDFVVSPLVVSRFLGSVGDPGAAAMAHSLMLMSKPIGPQGKMPYLDYIKRGLHDEQFDLVKLADVQQNDVIEPKIALTWGPEFERNRQKVLDYQTARLMLLQAVEGLSDLNTTLMAHAITAIDKNVVSKALALQRNAFNHHALARMFRQNVQLARAA